MNYIPEAPNNYIGKQVIINSDRLIFNAKNDSILLFSDKAIGFSTNGGFHFDTSPEKESKFIVNSPNIYLGLEDDDFTQLQAYHANPELLKGADKEDYLVDPSPLNIAFLYMQKSKGDAEKARFSPFKGTVSEVEDLRRHLVNLSMRTKESNPSLSKQYGDLAETVNSSLMAD